MFGWDIKQKLAAGGVACLAIGALGLTGKSYLAGPSSSPVAPTKFANLESSGTASSGPRSRPRQSSTGSSRPAYGSISINQAGQAELERLPRVGPVLARRIIDYRNQNGGFRSIDELDNVKGIGAKTLAQIRPYVKL